MKVLKKEIIILLLVIAVLIVVIWRQQTGEVHYVLPEFQSINTQKLEKIQLKSKDDLLVLVKENNIWKLEDSGFEATKSKVEEITKALEELELNALVSESKNYSRYELDPENKIQVKAWAGNKLLRELEVGKTAPTYKNAYIKLAKDPNIYMAKGNLRSKFDISRSQLRDKTVLSLNKDKLKYLVLHKGEKKIRFNPEMNSTSKNQEDSLAWKYQNGTKADSEKIKGLFKHLKKLRCSKYLPEESKEELGERDYLLEFEEEGEESLSIYVQKEDEEKNTYQGFSSKREYPFELSNHKAEKIVQAIDSFFESEAEDNNQVSNKQQSNEKK